MIVRAMTIDEQAGVAQVVIELLCRRSRKEPREPSLDS